MPVQFSCPECRRTLSVTRRKIGHQVACPKCAATIIVPNGQPALAGAVNASSVPAEFGRLDARDLVDFNDLPEMMVAGPRFRTAPPPTVIPTSVPVAPSHDSISRTSLYVQGVLQVLIAAVAFGLGYWFGGVDARRAGQSSPVAEAISTP